VFVNENPQSTLKLGQARGVVLLAAAQAGLEVGEYAPRLVKKAVVGTGARGQRRRSMPWSQRLLPGREDRRRRRGRRAGGGDHPRPSSRERRALGGAA
jgi:Holliday junction resolvasome RuvABC endonuclease subunit